QTVPALAAPVPAARPDVHVLDTLRLELLRTADVVDVVGIASIDEDVPPREVGQQLADRRVDAPRRDHQPDRSWGLQLLHEIDGRRGPDGFRPRQLLDRLGGPDEDDALTPTAAEPLGHVGTPTG